MRGYDYWKEDSDTENKEPKTAPLEKFIGRIEKN